tara:strand:- start:3148 stop:3453 length:306 start_codon:yes stop_codon:yes gene_type:complete
MIEANYLSSLINDCNIVVELLIIINHNRKLQSVRLINSDYDIKSREALGGIYIEIVINYNAYATVYYDKTKLGYFDRKILVINEHNLVIAVHESLANEKSK